MLKTLVIVPAYNEAKALPAVFADIRAASVQADILVVDDCSTDSTSVVAKNHAVKVLRLPVNLGIGGAVQSGFRYAVEAGYDVGVQFDGDGQHKACFIPQLIQPIEAKQADIVIGSRFLKSTTDFKTSAARRTGMILFSNLYRILTGNTITDTTSGFRAYSLEVMKLFARDYPIDFPDMPALLCAYLKGFRLIEIEVEMKQRQHGCSSTNFYKSVFYPFKSIATTCALYLRNVEHSK